MPVQEGPAAHSVWLAFLTERNKRNVESYVSQYLCFKIAQEGHEAASAQWEDWTRFYTLHTLTK